MASSANFFFIQVPSFSLQGLHRVSSYLLGPKCLHPKVVFLNLREDLAVDCDGSTFSPREVRTR